MEACRSRELYQRKLEDLEIKLSWAKKFFHEAIQQGHTDQIERAKERIAMLQEEIRDLLMIRDLTTPTYTERTP